MKDNDVLVSVCCTVYNHEKYLRNCLESIVMQKTNFEFEVLVHDDASTDCSADIIREYEKRYPKVIKPIYQVENQYSKGVGISKTYLYPNAKGKYIAFCEGDDFWTDDQKLQLQVNALEADEERVFSMHKVKGANENGEENGIELPPIDISSKEYDSDEFMRLLIGKKGVRFQTSSFLVRKNIVHNLFKENPAFLQKARVGDLVLQMYSALQGKLYYIDKEMSAYRMFSINSFSSNNVCDEKKYILLKQNFKEWFQLFDVYSNYKFHDCIKYEIGKIEKDIFQLKAVIIRKEMESIADKSAKTQKLMLYKKLLYYIFILRGGGLKNIWIKMKRWYSPDNNKKSL